VLRAPSPLGRRLGASLSVSSDHVIVPYAAGDRRTRSARVVSERMRTALASPYHQNVAARRARSGSRAQSAATPNGYTLSFGHVGSHVVNGALFALPFDLLKDLEPVALLPSNSLLSSAERISGR